jgi:hypothetical protein
LYSSALSPSSAAPPPPLLPPPSPHTSAPACCKEYSLLRTPALPPKRWREALGTTDVRTRSLTYSTHSSTTPHHHARRPTSTSHPRRLRPSIALHTRTRQSPCRYPVNITSHSH